MCGSSGIMFHEMQIFNATLIKTIKTSIINQEQTIKTTKASTNASFRMSSILRSDQPTCVSIVHDVQIVCLPGSPPYASTVNSEFINDALSCGLTVP